jgi:hypothetical protein
VAVQPGHRCGNCGGDGVSREPIRLTQRGETVANILAVLCILVTLASCTAIGKMVGL